MQSNRLLSPIVILVLSATACSEDKPSPSERCAELVGAHCDRLADCVASRNVFPTSSDRTRVVEACERTKYTMLNCDGVGSIKNTFERCIDDVSVAQCLISQTGNQTAFDLRVPLSCDGVLIGR